MSGSRCCFPAVLAVGSHSIGSRSMGSHSTGSRLIGSAEIRLTSRSDRARPFLRFACVPFLFWWRAPPTDLEKRGAPFFTPRLLTLRRSHVAETRNEE